ncbi:hypothetical protein TcasGA2_TC034256 [Tribolium castaneum]|uniref:Uncharacterized protein n=1 Tax=Tribolium castaneum TaxID=7070 RepID=A0A139WCH0_TRICA|nr:hypothetical protein TcasGA2_TC034256 [Tribolium castaneum]
MTCADVGNIDFCLLYLLSLHNSTVSEICSAPEITSVSITNDCLYEPNPRSK